MVEMSNPQDAKLPAVMVFGTLGNAKSTVCSKIAEHTGV